MPKPEHLSKSVRLKNTEKTQRVLRKQPGATESILSLDEGESDISTLKQKIRNDPQNSDFHNNLGVLLLFEQRFREAEKILKKATGLSSRDSDLWHNYGIVLYELDKKELAERAFRRAVKLSPDVPAYRLSLANISSSKKDYDGAISILSGFLGGEFDDPAVRINLAINFKEKGLLGLAIDQLEQASELTVGAKEEHLINLEKHAKKLMREYKKLREKGRK